MTTSFRARRPGRSGFTLIEMLVVLSIIGIILSFATRRHTLVIERSRDAALMLDLGHIRTAVHQFALEAGGRFPASLDELSPRYLGRNPAVWQGARAQGRLGYDPDSGRVTLLNAEGAALQPAPDSRGRPYGEY